MEYNRKKEVRGHSYIGFCVIWVRIRSSSSSSSLVLRMFLLNFHIHDHSHVHIIRCLPCIVHAAFPSAGVLLKPSVMGRTKLKQLPKKRERENPSRIQARKASHAPCQVPAAYALVKLRARALHLRVALRAEWLAAQRPIVELGMERHRTGAQA